MKFHACVLRALATLATVFFAASVSAGETGLLLAMKLSKGGQETLNPSIWSPVGAASSLSAREGLTIEVQSAAAEAETVKLNIGIREGDSTSFTTRRIEVTVPLEKRIRLQLGEDPATSWLIEFTPRITAKPGKAAA